MPSTHDQCSCCQPLLQEQGPLEFVLKAAQKNNVLGLQAMDDETTLWQKGKDGQFAVHVAAASNSLSVLAFLLSKGSAAKHGGIEATDSKKLTPLWHAVMEKSLEAVVWLVRHGANLKHKDMWGAYVIHAAAKKGSTSLVALLGNLGADLSESDPGGWKGTPLEIAAEHHHLELTEYLVLQRGGYDTEALQEACNKLSRGARDYWLRRVLTARVGCHEATPGWAWLCGPTFLGSCCCCGFPLLGLRCTGPEQVEVNKVHTSFASGLIAIFLGTAALCGKLPQGGTQTLPICEIVFAVITFAFYFRCIYVGSGHVLVTQESKAQYAQALDAAASVTEDVRSTPMGPPWWGDARGPVVHQLAAVGPERAKYCTATRRIVPVYDHYCTFVRGPIGRDNYAHFLAIITMASCSSLTSVWLLSTMLFANNGLAVSSQICLWIILFWYVMTGAAFVFLLAANIHLIAKGLTTWERIQMYRLTPAYLLDPVSKEFQNPYNKGFIRNFAGRLYPSRECDVVSKEKEITSHVEP